MTCSQDMKRHAEIGLIVSTWRMILSSRIQNRGWNLRALKWHILWIVFAFQYAPKTYKDVFGTEYVRFLQRYCDVLLLNQNRLLHSWFLAVSTVHNGTGCSSSPSHCWSSPCQTDTMARLPDGAMQHPPKTLPLLYQVFLETWSSLHRHNLQQR